MKWLIKMYNIYNEYIKEWDAKRTGTQEVDYRKWIRYNCHAPSYGFIVEDIDLVLRYEGKNYNLDSEGQFKLIEMKKIMIWVMAKR